MYNLEIIKKEFPKWNKKEGIHHDNREYKIIGCGAKAFKVLKFEPQHELGNKGGWSQVFWNYNDITPDSIAAKVIEKLQEKMGGQTTL